MLHPLSYASCRMPIVALAVLLMVNLVLSLACFAGETWTWRTFSVSWYANVLAVSFSLLSFASLGVVCFATAWGPGRAWQRGGVLVLLVVLSCLLHEAYVVLNERWILGYFRPIFTPDNSLLLASRIGNALSVCVPATMLLALLAGILRLRLGPPALGPVRIQIVALMISTAVLAALLVLNSEIQARFYGNMFSLNGNSDRANFDVSSQRLQTMLMFAITAPLAAISIALATWSYGSWRGRIALAVFLVGLAAFGLLNNRDAVWFAIVTTLTSLLAVLWISLHVHWFRQIGWVLSRRT